MKNNLLFLALLFVVLGCAEEYDAPEFSYIVKIDPSPVRVSPAVELD